MGPELLIITEGILALSLIPILLADARREGTRQEREKKDKLKPTGPLRRTKPPTI